MFLTLPICDRNLRAAQLLRGPHVGTSQPPLSMNDRDGDTRSKTHSQSAGCRGAGHAGPGSGSGQRQRQRVPRRPHLKKSWDSKVLSAGRHCGRGCSRAACTVCWKLARRPAATEIQSTVSPHAPPWLRASTAGDDEGETNLEKPKHTQRKASSSLKPNCLPQV